MLCEVSSDPSLQKNVEDGEGCSERFDRCYYGFKWATGCDDDAIRVTTII